MQRVVIGLYIEDQAFSPSYNLAPCPLPPQARLGTYRKTEKDRQLAEWRTGGGGGSQIIIRQESLVLYKTLNTLCYLVTHSILSEIYIPLIPHGAQACQYVAGSTWVIIRKISIIGTLFQRRLSQVLKLTVDHHLRGRF
jgi:hypothetical protein